MSWANYLFHGLGTKIGPVSHLAPRTDTEIVERIDTSTSLYTTKSNKDTFKPDMIFESFHHQARIPILDRALLEGFLMLWLKRCIMPTLPHEVIIVDVAYPAVLLACGRTLSMLSAMVGCIQSSLRVLTKSFCRVEALEYAKGNVIADKNGEPLLKMPDPRVELSYTYLLAWYVMHCLSLMTAVQTSEDFMLFVQKLEALIGKASTCT